MEIVRFDGNGRPRDDSTRDGDVLLLVQDGRVSVVRIELLDPDEYGPRLHHADNDGELAQEALALVRAEHPEALSSPADTTLRCPDALAARAIFSPAP